jgi:DNA modification methylase
MVTELKEYPIVELDINEIKEDKTNPNRMTLEQSRGLEKSLINFGRLKHIVVDQNNILIDGFHRWEIEKALGTKTLKVIQVHVESETEKKMMRETLNKLHGEYDPQKESDELLTIYKDNKLDDLADLLATPKTDLQDLISEYHKDITFPEDEQKGRLEEVENNLENIIKGIKPIVKRGEHWQLGNHRLYCGDSTDSNNIISIIGGTNTNNNNKQVNLVFTDPPYNIGFKYNEYDDNEDTNKYEKFCRNWFSNVQNVINPDLLIFTPGPRNVSIYDNIKKFDDIAIWYKNNSRSRGSMFYFRRCEPILFYSKTQKSDIIKNDNDNKKRTDDYYEYSMQNFDDLNDIHKENDVLESHAPAKTLSLIVDILRNYSKTGDLIFDMFLGTGTTIIAAEATGRTCYGIEIDERYCSVILERYYQTTRDDPIRVSDNKRYSELKKERYEEINNNSNKNE